MLSMKTLRVAIVAMGSALLLGPGLAAAVDLDGTSPMPVAIAVQTIPTPADVTAAGGTSATHHGINVGDEDFQITPGVRLAADEGYYIRVALGGGMLFTGTLTTSPGASDLIIAQGGAGHSQAVFQVLQDIAYDPTTPAPIQLAVDESLAVPNTNVGNYTASMTIHDTLSDAISGVNPLDGFGGQNVTVVRAVSGVDSTINPANRVADVATGFRWFVNPDAAARASAPNASAVNFGTATARAVATAADILNADTGSGGSGCRPDRYSGRRYHQYRRRLFRWCVGSGGVNRYRYQRRH